MGMNYYADTTRPCPNCDRDHDCQIHVGKSSGGWKFLFSTAFWDCPEDEMTFEAFCTWLSDKTIRDESGEEITNKEFWDRVASKQNDRSHFGPDVQDTRYYINLSGYDFMRGEFS